MNLPEVCDPDPGSFNDYISCPTALAKVYALWVFLVLQLISDKNSSQVMKNGDDGTYQKQIIQLKMLKKIILL